MVGLDDLESHFQTEQFYVSMIVQSGEGEDNGRPYQFERERRHEATFGGIGPCGLLIRLEGCIIDQLDLSWAISDHEDNDQR